MPKQQTKIRPRSGITKEKADAAWETTNVAKDIEYSAHLETTNKKELKTLPPLAKFLIYERPRHSKNDASTYVDINLTIKTMKIDSKTGSVDLRFIISCQWKLDYQYKDKGSKAFSSGSEDDNLKGADYFEKRVIDKEQLWYPPIEIFNKDELTIKRDPTLLYLRQGYARCLYHCNGSISNPMDLKLFPFDFNIISIKLIGSIGTKNIVKMFWRRGRMPCGMMDRPVIAQLTEWQVLIEKAFVERMNSDWCKNTGEDLVNRHVCGEMNGLEVTIPIRRAYGFYLKKIMLILTILCITGWTIIYIDEFVERLNIATSLLLAAIAFLYIVNEAIPKLSYLTAIDTMILSCFFNLFLGIVISFIVYWFHRKGNGSYDHLAFIVNETGFYLLPLSFVILTYGTMAMSIFARGTKEKEHWTKIGLIKNGNNLTVAEVLEDKDCDTLWETLESRDHTKEGIINISSVKLKEGRSQIASTQDAGTIGGKNAAVGKKLLESFSKFSKLLEAFVKEGR
jgi:hypothetical protein